MRTNFTIMKPYCSCQVLPVNIHGSIHLSSHRPWQALLLIWLWVRTLCIIIQKSRTDTWKPGNVKATYWVHRLCKLYCGEPIALIGGCGFLLASSLSQPCIARTSMFLGDSSITTGNEWGCEAVLTYLCHSQYHIGNYDSTAALASLKTARDMDGRLDDCKNVSVQVTFIFTKNTLFGTDRLTESTTWPIIMYNWQFQFNWHGESPVEFETDQPADQEDNYNAPPKLPNCTSADQEDTLQVFVNESADMGIRKNKPSAHIIITLPIAMEKLYQGRLCFSDL